MNDQIKFATQQYYLPTLSVNVCDDCQKYGLLQLESACGDLHTASVMCCTKNVCVDGCLKRCDFCDEVNRITLVDGYANGFKCHKCSNVTEFDIQWSGNSLMDVCKRYCNCSIVSWDGIVSGLKFYDPYETKIKVMQEIKKRSVENN